MTDPQYELTIGGVGDGCVPISGPAELPIYKPGGIFQPLHDAAQATGRDYTAVVDERKVICYGCTHGWILWKYAPTQNIKPDGSPYRQREGYCMLPATLPGGAPLPLEERFVLTCNRYAPREDLEASRAMAMGAVPDTTGDDAPDSEVK